MTDGEETPKQRPAPANDDGGEPAAESAARDEAAAAEDVVPEPPVEALPEPPTPEEEIAQLKDQLLRALAEGENVRRRGQRELEDARKYAIADFARDLLALADNLERAVASAGAERTSLLEGVELSQRQFQQVLEKFGIRKIEAEGQKLDPNLHQAMLQVESEGDEPGTVVEVLQVGYTIHDRLLRPAMVAVAKAPEAAPAEPEAAPPEAGEAG